MFSAPMFLRPENLWKDFLVEKGKGGLSATGRATQGYDTEGAYPISGVLAEADPQQKERFKQLEHPISHTITQQGALEAEAGDRLVLGSRHFYVQGVDDPGGLGLWAIYYAEERSDLDGGS